MCFRDSYVAFAACFFLVPSNVWAQTVTGEGSGTYIEAATESMPCRAVYQYVDAGGRPVQSTTEIHDPPDDSQAWERDWTDVFDEDPALLAARPDWNVRFVHNLPMSTEVLNDWLPLRVERATERYLRWLVSDETDPEFPARRIEVQYTVEDDLIRVRFQHTEGQRHREELNFSELNYDVFEYSDGRLVRAAFISTTWECVDSGLSEWTLHYDEAGRFVEAEYRDLDHPFCHWSDNDDEDREFDRERVRYLETDELSSESPNFVVSWGYDEMGRLETMQRVSAHGRRSGQLTGFYEYECVFDD